MSSNVYTLKISPTPPSTSPPPILLFQEPVTSTALSLSHSLSLSLSLSPLSFYRLRVRNVVRGGKWSRRWPPSPRLNSGALFIFINSLSSSKMKKEGGGRVCGGFSP